MRYALAMATLALVMRSGLAPAEPKVGWLDVTSDPPADIVLDGVDTRLVTPQKHLPVATGHHDLRLLTADARRSAIGFSVAAGRTTSLNLRPRK